MLGALPAAAHESRPIYIELNETALKQYSLQWKTPASVPLYAIPTVALPKTCQPRSGLVELAGSDGVVRRLSYHCPDGLTDGTLTITYPGANPSVSTLVRYTTRAGERHLAVLGPQERSWSVPRAETTSGVARQYMLLGIEHIWAGIDHLLFLVCLLWIAGTWRRILITITGFTLAHSATLVLSALQVIRLPVPAVEASIALSIVFLATEIAKGPRASLTWRHPIAISGSFGLLHGFGFAAALAEIGLPQTELATGLFFFNVGVEIGQVLFAAAAILAMRLLQRAAAQRLKQARHLSIARSVAGYAVGALAAFWLIARCAAFWPQ
jgi:hydrogenase/urease accessory protein HupE